MKPETECPYTTNQFNALSEEQREAVQSIAEYLNGDFLVAPVTDEEIGTTFNLFKPCDGAVPSEEIDGDIIRTIRRKFNAIFFVAAEWAERQIKEADRSNSRHRFWTVVDADYEDGTHIAIVDDTGTRCYLHEWHKAWHYHFETLAELADEVIRIKRHVFEQLEGQTPTSDKSIIYVKVEEGLVQDAVNVPSGFKLHVLDYDVEGAQPADLKQSPLDGKPCYESVI